MADKKEHTVSVDSFNEGNMRGIGNKKILKKSLFVSLAIIVTLAVLLFSGRLGSYSCKVRYTTNCAIDEGVRYIETDKIGDLRKTAENIKKLEDYNKNVNFLYILTVYYVKTGDSVSAKSYLEKFDGLYNRDSTLDPRLRKIQQTPFELRLSVEFLQKSAQEAKQNSWGIVQDGNSRIGGSR